MSDFDKLSPIEKAKLNRDRRREDILKSFQYKLYDLTEWKQQELERIQLLYLEELGCLNSPRVIQTEFGGLFV